jgi:hypothetical protein
VLDALVAEISLQRSCIDAVVSKLEAASVPEHVGVAEARPAEMTPEPPESLARLLMWELANEREDCCA